VRIVLVEPQIPQNTGNIARLAAATDSELHLVEPLGFSLSDRYLKRAGLDYWPYVKLKTHKSWADFVQSSAVNDKQLWFLSTHATKNYTDVKFSEGDYLVFGSETTGLDKSFHDTYQAQRLKIPMATANVRSLNLATSVGIVVYEAIRQRNSVCESK